MLITVQRAASQSPFPQEFAHYPSPAVLFYLSTMSWPLLFLQADLDQNLSSDTYELVNVGSLGHSY